MAESDIIYGRFIASNRKTGNGIQELPVYRMKKPTVGAAGHGGEMSTLRIPYQTPRCPICGWITTARRCPQCGGKC